MFAACGLYMAQMGGLASRLTSVCGRGVRTAAPELAEVYGDN